mgnify:CR=1 FL=1
MKLKYFIDRPILSIVISVGIIFMGLLSLLTLPVEQYPDIAPPTVSVYANYPGANAETAQKSVAIPLEEAINGVDKMIYMTSTTSNTGDVEIMVYFEQGTDPDVAAVNVQNRVSTALYLLPAEVTQTGVTTQKQQNSELMTFALYDPKGRYESSFLNNYMLINIQPRLNRISGIGKVQNYGANYSMRIWLNPEKMAHYGLVPSDINAVLASQNIEAATGSFGENNSNVHQYVMKYRGRLSTPEEFENIVLRSTTNGEVLRLGEVARIELGDETYTYKQTVNGLPASMVTLYQMPGSNASKTIQEVDATLEELKRDLPKGLEFIKLSDVNDFLDASIAEVIETLLIAIFLVVLVVYVFLQDIRSTLIPTISIVVSIIGTFAFMQVAGFSINLLTLFALVLAIGTVVDDAIIVVEAVQSKFEAGYQSSYKATCEAMSGVTSAIIASTIIFMAVFIPTAMMGGTAGTFYAQFGLTMAVAVALSTVNALTLSPALCALMLKPFIDAAGNEKNNFAARFRRVYRVAFNALLKRYKGGVTYFVKHPKVSWSVLVVALAFLIMLMKSVPTGFVPQEDTGVIFVSLNSKPGTSLNETTRLVKDLEADIKTIQGVKYTSSVSGFSFTGSGPSAAMMILALEHWNDRTTEDKSIMTIFEKIYELSSKHPDLNLFAMPPPMIPGYGMGNAIDLYLQDKKGGDYAAFKAVADTLVAELLKCPEIADAYCSFDVTYPQYWVDVDAAQCERAGITTAEVLGVLSGYFSGEYASNFNRFSKLYRVMVQAEPYSRVTPESLNHFYVRTPDGMAPLSQFVRLTKTYGPQSVSRFNLFNSIPISISPATGYSSGQAMQVIDKVMANKIPHNYSYELGGISREEKSSGNNTVIIFAVCIVLIYLVLCGLYESLIMPLSIILSVPCGLMGSLFFAWLFGLENNIYLQTGLIMLIGLLAKTAVLITEYAGERRKAGMTLKQAAIDAAKARLRPVLMTAMTMIIGMLPLMTATGVGAYGNFTLGTGVIGGMLIGTLTLIFLVPILWMSFQSLQERIKL